MSRTKQHYLYIAAIITLGGSTLSYTLLGSPGLIGMDDANITQVYAHNLSNGYGYVYTPGYERVEGSTSLLWTLLNVLAFSISSYPELIILFFCFLLTAGSIYFILCIFDVLCPSFEHSVELRLSVIIVLLGMLGFYAWNVLSLMDLALWTFLFNAMILMILRRVSLQTRTFQSYALFNVAVVLMGLARPEAMIVVPALLTIGITGEWKLAKCTREMIQFYALGLLFSLLTSGLSTLFRIFYFGVPFPNTFYAKVSSSLIDNVQNGILYLAKFSAYGPFTDLLIIIFSACAIACVWQAYVSKNTRDFLRLYRGLFVLATASLLILLIPLATGGDHFGSSRLYQPIIPLIWAVPIIFVLEGINRELPLIRLPRLPKLIMLLVTMTIFLAASASNFLLNNNIRAEFLWARNGRALGNLLNQIAANWPETRIAVGTAGGIARTYDGRVIDMLGLNWPKMAHASGRRTGIPGHSGFSEDVFWAEMPDLVLPSLSDKLPKNLSISNNRWNVFKELLNSEKFQTVYAPVVIPISGTYIVASAHRDWVQKFSKDSDLFLLEWSK